MLKIDGFMVFMLFGILDIYFNYFNKPGFSVKLNIKIIYEYCLDVGRLQKSELLSHG